MALERVGSARREYDAIRFEGDGFGRLWLEADALPEFGTCPLPLKALWFPPGNSEEIEFRDAAVIDVRAKAAVFVYVEKMSWFTLPLAQLLGVIAGTRKGAMISRMVGGGAPTSEGLRTISPRRLIEA